MTRHSLTPAEQAIYDTGWRAGAQTILDYAGRTATAIEGTSKRHVHEGFAVAALRGLTEACADLLKPDEAKRRAA